VAESVYIVGAYDPDTARVACLQVISSLSDATYAFSEVKAIYGGSKTFLASRCLDQMDFGAPHLVDLEEADRG